MFNPEEFLERLAANQADKTPAEMREFDAETIDKMAVAMGFQAAFMTKKWRLLFEVVSLLLLPPLTFAVIMGVMPAGLTTGIIASVAYVLTAVVIIKLGSMVPDSDPDEELAKALVQIRKAEANFKEKWNTNSTR